MSLVDITVQVDKTSLPLQSRRNPIRDSRLPSALLTYEKYHGWVPSGFCAREFSGHNFVYKKISRIRLSDSKYGPTKSRARAALCP